MATVFPAMRGVYQRQVGQWKWLTWPPNKQGAHVYLFYDYFSHSNFHTHLHTIQLTGLVQFGGVAVFGGGFCRLFLLAISIHLPLPTRDQEQDAPRKKFSLSEVCAHNLDRRKWRKMSQQDSMGLTVPTLPIICPFRL